MPKSKPRATAGKAPTTDWRKSLGVHPGFPLFPHQSGWWAKKVKGKLYYFGKMADDPKGQAALVEWDRVKVALIGGRARPSKVDGVTVAAVCDQFLQAKEQLVKSGEITQKTWHDYKRVTDRLVARFGESRVMLDLGPDDFTDLRADFSKTNGVVALANFIQRVRIVCKFAYDQGKIPTPLKFGQLFKRPSVKALRIQKAKSAPKLFSADEVTLLIESAPAQLRAMILLGVNAGLGNNDCAALEQRHLDLAGGWMEFARVKTGTKRRCPLWPETVDAIKAALAVRKKPTVKAHEELVFVTRLGGPWASAESHDSPVAKEFAKLAKRLKLQSKGRGFYSLRHTFRTVADGARDVEATRCSMGHTSQHVEAGYIETLPEDSRLSAVANHVRAWLFPSKPAKGDTAKSAGQGRAVKPRKAPASGSPRVSADSGFQLRVVG